MAEEAHHRVVADLDQDQQLQPVQVKLKLWIIRDTLIFVSQMPILTKNSYPTLGNEDNAEVVDASGSSIILNAASYVLSSQIGEKVNKDAFNKMLN